MLIPVTVKKIFNKFNISKDLKLLIEFFSKRSCMWSNDFFTGFFFSKIRLKTICTKSKIGIVKNHNNTRKSIFSYLW